MPNTFAYLMLMIWPAVCIALFLRLRPERAIAWSIIGGYLLLPERTRFDLPLMPALGKSAVPALSVFLICVFLLRRKVPILPRSTPARILVLLFLFSVVLTTLTNAEPLQFRDAQLPGMTMRDLLGVMIRQLLVLLPFLIAREFLATDVGLREILLALAIGGLVYSVPALFEVRMSPQLHIWVYGFFQHDFEQMMRDGGFRPVVFLRHALWLALFILSAMLANAALSRSADRAVRFRFLAATVYLGAVLLLTKSLAAQLYGIIFTPLLLFTGPRVQIRVALTLALIAVIYPMLRNAGAIPVDFILEKAAAIDPDRANSLQFRVNNENLLLARAAEKPWFGWGSYGRNLIHDPGSGAILTIPDGRWIIAFGSAGWAGYVAEMGLLALPLLLLAWCHGRSRNRDISPFVAAIAIILAANMIDMLLNATLEPPTWMMAGAILGYCERKWLALPAERSRLAAKGAAPLIGGRRRERKEKTIL